MNIATRRLRSPQWNLSGLVVAAALALMACADASAPKDASDARPAVCTDPVACEGACGTDRDCPIGQRCESARCVSDTPAPTPDQGVPDVCQRNGDCPDGMGCDRDTRTCVPLAPESRGCDDVRDCFVGEACVDNLCVPAPPADGAVVAPDAQLDATPPTPDAASPSPDGAVVTPDAAVATPDAAVSTPDAAACTPAPESCNGADDDCDGEIDEDFGLGDACDVGVGACQVAGTVVCGPNGDSTCDAVPGVP